MLPELNLEEEEFEGIVEEARNKIMGLYPKWTDFNYHDPGITIIELFSWIKENQQYYMNQTSDEMKLQFLKLLGVEKYHKKAASTFLQMSCEENRSLPKGTKAYAGPICFETTRRKQLVGKDILCMIAVRGTKTLDYIDRRLLEFGHRIRFQPFGLDPQAGDMCYFAFDFPLPRGEQTRLYLDIWEDYAVARNKIKEKMTAPLAELSIQYFTENGWENINWKEDLTYGFLTDGFLSFHLEKEMKPTKILEHRGYFIRIILKNQEYDVPPCITRASINIEELRQTNTLSQMLNMVTEGGGAIKRFIADSYLAAEGMTRVFYEREGIFWELAHFEKQIRDISSLVFIEISYSEIAEGTGRIKIVNRDPQFNEIAGIANGLPFQEIRLEDKNLEYESFELMIREEGGGYHVWNKVFDFSKSAAGDRHYRLDEETGSLAFGDGIRGRMPKGEIYLASYVRTLGSLGNVKENKINHLLVGTAPLITKVWNIENAFGGMEVESIDDCFLRAAGLLKKPDCAVTDEDYEEYVKHTPGLMTEACRVIRTRPDTGYQEKDGAYITTLVIKPFHPEKRQRMSKAYEKNIRSYLEQFRPVGTVLRFVQPEYIPVTVMVQIMKNPRYRDARQQVRESIMEFFSGQEADFGVTLHYGSLYGRLEQLPCVSSLRSLSVETRSSRVVHLTDGNMVMPPNGLMYLQDIKDSYLTEG